MSAVIICKQPSEFVPTVSFAPISVGGSVSSSSVVVDSIKFKKVDITGSSSNYLASQLVPQFKPDWVMTSETPAICTISGNLITRVSNGTGVIRFSGPNGFSIVSKVDFTSTGYSKYVWTGFSGTSKSSTLADPILNLLSPTKTKNYFAANYVLGSTSISRNTNCWAAPLDLTGSAISTTLWGENAAANSGALITPQHWIGVAHFGSGNDNMGPGARLRFAGSDGIVYLRTVLRRDYNAAKDRITCLLDAPLPASVKPFKFAGSGMFDFPNKRAWGMGWQITQEKYITPVSFDNIQVPPRGEVSTAGIFWFSNFTEADTGLIDPDHQMYPVRNLVQNGRTGDSGGAIGGYYNGETYLISLFSSANAGALYTSTQTAELNTVISGLDVAQGIATGYTVGVLTIS